MDTLPSFGVWVRQRRRALDLTQEKLAQRAHYSVVTIRKVEAGGLRPSLALAEQLADALEIAPEQRTAFVKFARTEPGAALPLPPPASTFPLARQQRSGPDQAQRLLHVGTAAVVGRQREWAVLQRVWQKARQGQAQCAIITGEAGIGKTRLAEEMLHETGRQGALAARTRSYAAQGALAFTPITELLRSETMHSRLSKLDAVWLVEVARLLPEILVTRPDLPRPLPIAESWQRQRFFEALARAILVEDQPLALLFDDLQWCDRETFEWLHYLFYFAPQARLLVLGTVRLDEVGQEHPYTTLHLHMQRTDQITELELNSLSQEETTTLATRITGKALTAKQADQLYRDTEGNPLFVVEMARAQASRETSAASALEPAVIPTEKEDVSNLPPKIHAVIRARLLQLSPQAQELASLAAVIGRSFTARVLAAASRQEEETLVRSLDELWQRRIVREGDGDRYDFSHDKIREVAYRGVSRVRRRLLHHQVAETLARLHAQDLDEVCGQLAAHYEQTGEAAEAVRYYQRAGETAHRISAYEDAIAFFNCGLQLLQSMPESRQRDAQELELQTALAVPLAIARGYAEPGVLQAYLRAWALSIRLEQAPSAPVMRGLALAHLVVGAVRQANGMGQQLLRLSKQVDDPAQRVEAHYLLGVTSFWMGAFTASRTYLEEAVAHYDPQRHRRNIELYSHESGAICLVRLALTLWVLGYADQAIARSRAALELAQAQSHAFSLAYVHAYAAWLHHERGELDLAAAENQALLLLCRPQTHPFWPPTGWIVEGGLRVARGEIQEGIAQIQRGLVGLETETQNLHRPYLLALAAQAYAAAGRPEHGLMLVQAGLAAAEKTEEHFWDAELHRLSGLLLLARQPEQTEKVEAAFQQAISLAHSQAAKALELRAALNLARLWQAQGKVQAARELLAPRYAWFGEGLDTADLRAACTLLAALS
jgi:predicted ATPase/transcriptional regulator with XRE-family HTH domain